MQDSTARFANIAAADDAAKSNAADRKEDTMGIAHGFLVPPGAGGDMEHVTGPYGRDKDAE